MEHARAHITDPAKVDYRPMNAFLLPPPWHRGRVGGDRRCRPHHDAASGDRRRHRHRGCGGAGGTAGRRGAVADILDRFIERRFERCKLVVDTAVKLGEMEKDTSIPIQAHFELMGQTFRKLAEPI